MEEKKKAGEGKKNNKREQTKKKNRVSVICETISSYLTCVTGVPGGKLGRSQRKN